MLDKKDLKILTALIEAKEPITSYKIYLETGITLTTVNYKLTHFVQCGIVTSGKGNGRKTTVYSSHPLLSCDKCMIEMAKLIQKQTEVIDEHGHVSVEGVKTLLDFIIQRVNIVERDIEICPTK